MRPSVLDRFNAHVLKGPDPDSCWLWLGAVSDDGYGRFWLPTPNGQQAVGAHRFALATVHGGLETIQGLETLHWCDVPLCVHATVEPTTHLLAGTRSQNMLDRARKGRMPSATTARWRRLSKAERAARSRQLRDVLKVHGWDVDLIRELVHGIDPDHPTLF